MHNSAELKLPWETSLNFFTFQQFTIILNKGFGRWFLTRWA